ncbi:MAG: SpvB/TcaC N-terminal domain-containing protein, partial [Woeseia sp.]
MASPSFGFVANLSGSPNPNTGDYTVSWDNPGSLTYYLEENPGGTSGWSTITSSSGSSHAFTGKSPNDYLNRLKYRKRVCTGWPEPSCYFTTRYSETATVTVEAPPSGNGGDDPFPAPAPFTPPSSANFPDATIVYPGVPSGDVGLNSVGALKGQGAVSGGQASYSIPIVVPPGRKGMQPSVSLNYSSSSGNGVVGVGWSLGATSSISRCAATAAQDGFSASVQFDASRDRLCLDGQRLMVVTGSYGASGATYRTELDIFARIRQYNAINSAGSYFTVEYKDGTTSRFGYNSNSRHKLSGKSETLTWLISDSQDRSGNTIAYAYVDHGNGESNLDAIHYTGFNGSNGDRHVRFVYATRPDTRTYFMAGGKTLSTKRLTKIRAEYQSTLVREYTLNYGSTQSLSSKRSLLRSVQECAYEAGVRHCFPATSFEWQEHAPQYGIAGGAPETLKYFNGSSWQAIHADKRWLHDVIPNGDVNGDGVKDWPGITVNAEGQRTDSHDPTILANCFTPLGSAYLKCLQVDFNNDGLTDSFRKNNGKFEVKATVLSGSSSWINTGVNWATPGAGHDDHPLGFADFNGDGWMDLAFV